jgi:hypothetical protein
MLSSCGDWLSQGRRMLDKTRKRDLKNIEQSSGSRTTASTFFVDFGPKRHSLARPLIATLSRKRILDAHILSPLFLKHKNGKVLPNAYLGVVSLHSCCISSWHCGFDHILLRTTRCGGTWSGPFVTASSSHLFFPATHFWKHTGVSHVW